MKLNALFLCALMCMSSCSVLSHRESGVPDKQTAFRSHIENGEHYEAHLMIDEVMEELKDVDEGAAGHEYNLLVSTTAGTGQRDWVRILEEPRISLEHKLDLVEEIHEGAVKSAQ